MIVREPISYIGSHKTLNLNSENSSQNSQSSEWIPLSEAANFTPYSADYLSLLARKRRLTAKKIDGIWYTTRGVLNNYLAQQAKRAEALNQSTDAYDAFLENEQTPVSVVSESELGKGSPVLKSITENLGSAESILPVPGVSETTIASVPVAEPSVVPVIEVVNPVSTASATVKEPVATDHSRSLPNATLSNSGSGDALMEEFMRRFNAHIDQQVEVQHGWLFKVFRFLRRSFAYSVLSSRLPLFLVCLFLIVILPLRFVSGFADNLFQGTVDAVKNAQTVMGFRPGTHENEILLLGPEGEIAIFGNVETEGQFRSYVEEGIAPITVKSTTKVDNLNVDMLDGTRAHEFTLAYVTKNGNVTYEPVYLEGRVEVGETLLVRGATQLLQSLSVDGNLSVFGEANFSNGINVAGPAIFKNLITAPSVVVSDLLRAHRLIVEDEAIFEGLIRINDDLDVEGSISAGSGRVRGSFSVDDTFRANGDVSLGADGSVVRVTSEDWSVDNDGNAEFQNLTVRDASMQSLSVNGNSSFGGAVTLGGALNDVDGSAGSLGYVLQSTGTSTRWVATSTLGFVGGGGSGITSLNGQTGAAQTFATGTATGIGLTVTSSGGVHTFTPTISAGYSMPLTASTTEWSTAYAWGDHSLAGYLTTVATTTVRDMFSTGTGLSYATSTGIFTNTGVLSIGGLTGNVATSSLGFNDHASVTLTGENYLSLTGQQITANAINLASSHVTGILPVLNGGTGASGLTGILLGNGTSPFTATTTLSASYIEDAYVRNTGDSMTGNLVMSGAAANIALGSNYLSGDGDDEGVFVGPLGYVGIGTSSPEHLLDIRQANNSYGVRTTDGTTEAVVGISNTNTGLFGTRSNHATQFITDNTVQATILANGNFGVGDTSPASLFTVGAGDAFQVTATGTVSSGTWNGNDIDISDYTNLAVGNGVTLTDDTLTVTAAGGLAQTAGGLTTTGVLEDLNTLGVPTMAGQFIVSTGAGAFAYQATSTARSSLGLGALATLNAVDISANTNLAVTATGLTLNNDTLELTSGYTIPLTASTTEWSTAFGWGNHGLAGYLSASSIDTSAELAAILTDETGTGSVVFSNSPTLTGNTTLANASTTNLTVSTNSYLGTVRSGTWNGATIGVPFGGTGATSLTGVLLGNGTSAFTATTTLAQGYGGTGMNSYAAGDIIYADSGGNLAKLPIGTGGQVLKVSAGLPSWGLDLTAGGGGGGDGVWATSTNIIYPADPSNVVLVGNNATTTSNSILEVTGNSYFSGNVGIGDTSPAARLTVGAGDAFQVTSLGVVASGTWNGTDIDISDYTNLAVTATGLTLNNDTLELTSGYTIPLTASTTEWSQAYASTTALTPSYIRNLFSNTATGLTYNSTTGATSLTAGYNIPLTASTTNWNNFYNTPSTRVTAGDGLSWSTNTLNLDINELTEESGFTSGDFLAFYDATAGAVRKVNYNDLPGAGGGLTSLNGLTNASQNFATTSSNGLTLAITSTSSTHTFALGLASGYTIPLTASTTNWNSFYDTPSTRVTAGDGISWSANTLNLDINELTPESTFETGDFLAFYDSSAGGVRKVTYADLPGAGGGITSLNGLTNSVQSFATTSDTNIGMNVVSSGSTHTFTPTWTGTLAVPRGGTGASTLTGLVVGNGASAMTATTTSAGLAAVLSNETGTGSVVFSNSPTLTGNTTLANASTTNLTVSTNSYLGTVQGGTWQGSVIADTYVNDALTISGGTINNTPIGASTPSTGVFTNATSSNFFAGSATTTNLLATNFTATNFNCTDCINATEIEDIYVLNSGDTISGNISIGTTTSVARLTVQSTGTSDILNLHETGGVEVFTVLENGNVGVGDTTPAALFTVGTNDAFQVNSSGQIIAGDWQGNTIDLSTYVNLAVGATGLTLNDDTLDLTAGYNIPLTASTTNWNNFYNTPSTRITAGTGLSWTGNTLNSVWTQSGNNISSNNSGNVGIGTTTPLSRLSVQSTDSSAITLVSGATKAVRIGASSVGGIIEGVDYSGIGSYQPLLIGGSNVRLSNSGSEVVRITGDNVGIGTTTPGTKLDVYGNARFGATWSTSFTDGNLISFNRNAANYILASNATGLLLFGTGGRNDDMIITSAGNVGIGTTTPNYTLTVAGDTNQTGALRFNGNAGTTGQILVSNGSSVPTWTATSSLGLGTSFFQQNGNSFGTTAVLGTNDNQALQFETNNSVALTISTSSNVGIGDTTPLSLFTVGAGDAFQINSSGVVLSGTWNGTDIDISDYTNLSVSNGITLTGDVLSVTAAGGLAQTTGGLTTTGVLEDLNTLGAPTLDGQFIVATGPGTFAYEATSTARASLGLVAGGDGDIWVEKAGDTMTGNLTMSGSAANIILGPNYLSGDGGDEGVFVSSTGNVGIGTSTPSRRLQIEYNSPELFSVQRNGYDAFGFYQSAGTGLHLYNYTDGRTDMYIAGDTGNVGVGTTTPTNKLSVSGGNVYLENSSNPALITNHTSGVATALVSGTNKSSILFDDTGSFSVQVRPKANVLAGNPLATASVFEILSNGNVGIGTTTPIAKLQVLSTTEQLRLSYDPSNYWTDTIDSDGGRTMTGFGSDGDLDIIFTGASDGDFSINGDDLFVDTSAGGFVGIGNTAPSTLLEVSGSSGTNYKGSVRLSNDTIQYGYSMINTGAGYANPFTSATVSSFNSGDPVNADFVGGLFPWTVAGGGVGLIGNSEDAGAPGLYFMANQGVGGANQAAMFFNAAESDGAGGIGSFETTEAVYKFAHNSTAVLTITGANNIGVGNTSPSTRLTVGASNSSSDEIISVISQNNAALVLEADTDNVTETHNPYLKFSQDGGAVVAAMGYTGGANIDSEGVAATGVLDNAFVLNNRYASGATQFTTNSTVRLTIAANGNVGIGTTTPASTLSVAGSMRLTGAFNDASNSAGASGNILSSTGSGTAWVSTSTLASSLNAFVQNGNSFGTTAVLGTNDNQALQFETNGSVAMTILANNNVGINDTSPSAKLDITTSGASTDGIHASSTNGHEVWLRPSMGAGTNNSIVLADDGGIIFSGGTVGSSAGFVIAPWAGATSGMRIDSSGNVGIGTASPGYRLDLAGGTFGFGTNNSRTETRNDAGLQGNAGAQSGFFETSSPTNYPTGATSWWHLIDSRHNNTSNNYAMQIAGSFFDQDFYVRKTGGSATTGWSKMVLENSAGNVGIGTTSPATKLDVWGATYINSANESRLAYTGDTYLYTQPVANSHIRMGVWDTSAGALPLALQPIGGNVGIGDTTPASLLTVGNGDLFQVNSSGVITAVAGINTSSGAIIDFADTVADKIHLWSNLYGIGIESGTLTNWSGSAFRWRIGGTSASSGTEQMILNSTGLSVTGTLSSTGAITEAGSAVLSAGDIDTCAELISLVAAYDTGTCGNLVFSASPTFTGTVNAAALTLSSTLTMSGSAANIALGSNYLSGDGGDEGVFVDSAGNVGIGTTGPVTKLEVSDEIISGAIKANGGNLRMIGGNYGAFFRNDGSNTYLLFTNSGDQYGTFNALRPIFFSNTTGGAGMGNGLAMSGSASNIALGSNYLSGDGGDEGVFVDSAGNVGVANSAPAVRLHVGSTADANGTVLLRLQDVNSSCDFTANATLGTCTSDGTLKTDVESIEEGSLALVSALRPVSYHWKNGDADDPLMRGFIAQEVEEIIPSLVTDRLWYDGTMKKSLNIGGMIPYAIGAIGELNLSLEELLTTGSTTASTTFRMLTEEGRDTIWSRLVALAEAFTDGVLKLASAEFEYVKADRIETNELCVGSVCVDEDTFLQMVEMSGGAVHAMEHDPEPADEEETPPSEEEETTDETETSDEEEESEPTNEESEEPSGEETPETDESEETSSESDSGEESSGGEASGESSGSETGGAGV